MDGTLTLPIHNFEDIRKQLGLNQGEPILEAIDKMPQDKSDRAKKLLHELEMDLAYNAKPQPEAEWILESLINKGRQLGILTRNGEEITYATLEAAGLRKYFKTENIVGRDTCAPKPNPDGVHHLLDLWNAEKQQTVIVGDYLYDIEAGFTAGVTTVHFDHLGVFSWPEFTHHRIQQFGALMEMI